MRLGSAGPRDVRAKELGAEGAEELLVAAGARVALRTSSSAVHRAVQEDNLPEVSCRRTLPERTNYWIIIA